MTDISVIDCMSVNYLCNCIENRALFIMLVCTVHYIVDHLSRFNCDKNVWRFEFFELLSNEEN